MVADLQYALLNITANVIQYTQPSGTMWMIRCEFKHPVNERQHVATPDFVNGKYVNR